MEELINYLKERDIDYLNESGRIDEYFDYLEEIRNSGITNMYGAAPYLEYTFCLDPNTARSILSCWMKFYKILKDKLGWN